MILENGQIRFNGVGDFEDAPVSAALALIAGYPIEVNINKFFSNFLYQRCANARYRVSRDQYIAITTAIHLKEKENNDLAALIGTDRLNGLDLIPNSVKGHTRRCKGKAAFFWQDWGLWLDVKFHAMFTPRAEASQLICMMWLAPPKFLKWWVENNHFWQESITDYLRDSFRDETELSLMLIDKIKKRIA